MCLPFQFFALIFNLPSTNLCFEITTQTLFPDQHFWWANSLLTFLRFISNPQTLSSCLTKPDKSLLNRCQTQQVDTSSNSNINNTTLYVSSPLLNSSFPHQFNHLCHHLIAQQVFLTTIIHRILCKHTANLPRRSCICHLGVIQFSLLRQLSQRLHMSFHYFLITRHRLSVLTIIHFSQQQQQQQHIRCKSPLNSFLRFPWQSFLLSYPRPRHHFIPNHHLSLLIC